MRLLRITDGTDPHLRALRYHAQQCRRKQDTPPFKPLLERAIVLYKELKDQSREVEDAEEKATDCTADVDNAEVTLEDDTRVLHIRVMEFDRRNPQLGALDKIFPQGLDGVLIPERQKQVTPIKDLQQRLEPFLTHAPLQEANEQITASLKLLQDALAAKSKQDEELQLLFHKEVRLREKGREQLKDAEGQLTSFFKGSPNLRDNYFIPDPRKGSTARAGAEERGRVGGKIEALSRFLKSRQITLSAAQEELLQTTLEEDKIDQALDLAYAGATLEAILAALAQK